MTNKYLEKLASSMFLRGAATARRMASTAGKAVAGYASQIPGDAARLGTNLKNVKTINNVSGAGGVAKMLATNKAVQVGAGAAAGGYLLNKALSKKKDNDQ